MLTCSIWDTVFPATSMHVIEGTLCSSSHRAVALRSLMMLLPRSMWVRDDDVPIDMRTAAAWRTPVSLMPV